jgi:hypothetical protein
MDENRVQEQQNDFQREPCVERRQPGSIDGEGQEMSALTGALPPSFSDNSQKPASLLGWTLVFVSGAFVWAALFYWLS